MTPAALTLLEAEANHLWSQRRLEEAADLYDVIGDVMEECGVSALRIQGARGAARRLRVTAWIAERWPERELPSDRHIYPDYWIGTSRQVWAVRFTRGEVWQFEYVTIDKRGNVRFATDSEKRRSRYRW